MTLPDEFHRLTKQRHDILDALVRAHDPRYTRLSENGITRLWDSLDDVCYQLSTVEYRLLFASKYSRQAVLTPKERKTHAEIED